jgi:hypothetical protein
VRSAGLALAEPTAPKARCRDRPQDGTLAASVSPQASPATTRCGAPKGPRVWGRTRFFTRPSLQARVATGGKVAGAGGGGRPDDPFPRTFRAKKSQQLPLCIGAMLQQTPAPLVAPPIWEVRG